MLAAFHINRDHQAVRMMILSNAKDFAAAEIADMENMEAIRAIVKGHRITIANEAGKTEDKSIDYLAFVSSFWRINQSMQISIFCYDFCTKMRSGTFAKMCTSCSMNSFAGLKRHTRISTCNSAID
jgi:hypothetical protein